MAPAGWWKGSLQTKKTLNAVKQLGIMCPPPLRLFQIPALSAIAATIVGSQHPGDQQLQITVLLQNAQQTVFAEVMDVPKILMFHRSPELIDCG
jgi:hypothetical protein